MGRSVVNDLAAEQGHAGRRMREVKVKRVGNLSHG
jgi:hypothetical protein